MSLQTPRVLPNHLHAFPLKTVRLLGTISALRGDTATITCGSNGDVTLIVKADSQLLVGRLVEVVGKVVELEGGLGLGVKVLGSMAWGNPADCDYKIYESVVDATHRFKTIFYDA